MEYIFREQLSGHQPYPKLRYNFTLQVELPNIWHSISQGDVIRNAENRIIGFACNDPMDEIYLIAGPYIITEDYHDNILIQTYTYQEDTELSSNYLAATKRYLDMYQSMIGPYPYSKFAMVENFWETGYGMPSFTLLGKTVIRLPFIIGTSYGHEILHNWWGNSVFVDYASGNWCEGLTTYLADHHYKELSSAAEATDYRFNSLVSYRNFVTSTEDFPLTDFRGRFSAETQAVGYNKSLFTFHMLKAKIGEVAFNDALRNFYKDYIFQVASWTNLQDAFAAASGQNLDSFFDQWVEKSGAPTLKLSNVTVEEMDNLYRIKWELTQPETYDLLVPVKVDFTEGETLFTVPMTELSSNYTYDFVNRPVQLTIDPNFDLFRKLDRSEIPPTLSQTMGADTIKVILPSKAGSEMIELYKSIPNQWYPDLTIEVLTDINVNEEAIKDAHLWIFGNPIENLLLQQLIADFGKQVIVDEIGISIAGNRLNYTDNSFLLSGTHPYNNQLSWSALYLPNNEITGSLIRKIPHYGKYGYLGFEGDKNIVKGSGKFGIHRWFIDSKWSHKMLLTLIISVLIDTSPIDMTLMRSQLEYLASKELQGRGIGTDGIELAVSFYCSYFQGVWFGSYCRRWRLFPSF